VIEATITERLRAGITVGDRDYRVLGGSNSLVGEHGYYLCASYLDTSRQKTPVTAESIRKSIGEEMIQYNKNEIINITPPTPSLPPPPSVPSSSLINDKN